MVEYWAVLGMVGALSLSLHQAYQKKLSEAITPIKIAHQSNFIAIPFALAVVIVTTGFHVLKTSGFILAFFSSVLTGLGYYSLAEAYKKEDLSTISPLLAASPILVSLIEPIIFHTNYDPIILIAATLTTIGIYIVLAGDDYIEPLVKIGNKGVILGLLSMSFFSFALLVNRVSVGLVKASPIMYSLVLVILTTFTTASISGLSDDWKLKETLTPTIKTIPLGVFRGLMLVTSILALYLATGAEVSILLQVGVVLPVLFGGIMFSEDNMMKRGIGGVIILIGASLVLMMA